MERVFIIFFIIIGVAILVLANKPKNRKHKYYIKESKKILAKLKSFEHSAQKINYLKKINPYVFEELILSALELQEYKIIRNKKYSNDGGIDGKAIINNEMFYIQAKRYKDFVQINHIDNFSEICENNAVKGLFIHTGKSRKHYFKKYNNIEIISGHRLLKLLSI